MLLPRKKLSAPLRLDAHGHDFSVEASAVNRTLGALLRAQRILILLLARYIELTHKNFSSFAHHHFGQGTEESVAIHPIEDFLFAEPISPTRAVEVIRKARHGFCAACEYTIHVAVCDFLKSESDGLQSGGARLIDRVRRYTFGNSAAHRNLATDIGPSASLARVADDGFFDLLSSNPRMLQRRFDCDDTHICGGHVRQ